MPAFKLLLPALMLHACMLPAIRSASESVPSRDPVVPVSTPPLTPPPLPPPPLPLPEPLPVPLPDPLPPPPDIPDAPPPVPPAGLLSLLLLAAGDGVADLLAAMLSLGVAVSLLVSEPLPVGATLALPVALPLALGTIETLGVDVRLRALGDPLGVAGDANTDCVMPLSVALAVMERVEDCVPVPLPLGYALLLPVRVGEAVTDAVSESLPV